MVTLRQHAEGWIVPVRAQPRARKEGVLGEQAGALKLAVTAPPDQGRANKALRDLLCRILDLKRSQVDLQGGEKSRDKTFLIRGLSKTELENRIARLLGTK